MAYYAVKNGRNVGIYKTWDECKKEVLGFQNAQYKKFKNYQDAVNFIEGSDSGVNSELQVTPNRKKKYFSDEDIKKLKDDEAVAYVDGSFDSNNKTYSYGVVYFTNDSKETYSGRLDNPEMASMRNVSGELEGAKVAMQKALENKETLYLHYDYTGIEEWAMGRWKANKEGVKSYKSFYDSIKNDLQVIFIKVPAHEGIKYNEEADQLAKDAIL